MAYFANGTEGMAFDEECGDCIHEDPDVGCPIALVQSLFNYDQLNKGNEQLREAITFLVGNDGKCKMKPLIEKYYKKKPVGNQLKLEYGAGIPLYKAKKWGA